MLGWVFVALSGLGLSIYVYLVWNFNYWKKRKVPGPKPKLLVGNIPAMFTYSRHLAYDIHDIYCQYKGREGVVGCFFARQPHLLVLDPKLVREFIVTNFKNFQKNDLFFTADSELHQLVAQNPFFLTGAEWKQKRAEITPALTANRIKASFPIMQNVCQKMTKYLEMEFENPPKDGIEAKDLASRYTVEVVANCIFGLEAKGFSKDESILLEEATEIFSSNSELNGFFLFVVATFPLVNKIVRVPLISNESEQFFLNLMNDAIKHREQTKDDRVDFLNYLLQLRERKNMFTLDMASHILSFFIDGFETSSLLISHCIHLLAKHKDVQEKLRQEINDAISVDGELSFERLMELPYLDCVIYETLRLFPPGIFLSKVCTEPYEFNTFNGKTYSVEKGIIIEIPLYSIHRDEEFYNDPDEFIPDRFSIENGGIKKYKDMGVFFPFGDGPRVCLGMRFGLTQSKAAIAELAANWEMSVNTKTRKKFLADPKNFSLLMEGGLWIDFKKISEAKKNK